MDIFVKKFDELTLDELYGILRLRAEVFVVEQKCAYQDLDGLDKASYHIWLQDAGGIAAYARVLDIGGARIGRVISARRRQGLGTRVLQECIRVAREVLRAGSVTISAQEYAREFYEKSGFRKVSDTYLEDGIPHIKMELNF